MKLILLGAPGAGKGTQAEIISKKLNIPTISTGNILREAIKNGTETGLKAKSFMDAGKLVPDDVIIGIVRERVARADCANGFILDGVPRTIPQAEALERILGASGRKIDWIINIVVDEDTIVERLSNRKVCPACNETYHMKFNPAENNRCRNCGTQLVEREDDRPEVIRHRIASYHKKTEPLIDFYRHRGKLLNVRSENSIPESLQNTLYALGLKGI